MELAGRSTPKNGECTTTRRAKQSLTFHSYCGDVQNVIDAGATLQPESDCNMVSKPAFTPMCIFLIYSRSVPTIPIPMVDTSVADHPVYHTILGLVALSPVGRLPKATLLVLTSSLSEES